jgi:hypothetical protein
MRGVDFEIDGLIDYPFASARNIFSLDIDLSPYFFEILELLTFDVKKLSIGLLNVVPKNQLDDKRAPSHDSRSTRKKIFPNEPFQNARFSRRLGANNNYLG